MNIEQIKAKAAELRDKYGATVVIQADVWAWGSDGTTECKWRIHVVEKACVNERKTLEDAEQAIAVEMEPQNLLTRAAALESEAAALRASVAGGANV